MMDDEYTKNFDLMQALKAPFDIEQHEFVKGSGGRFYVYIQKKAIQDRLDYLFPMQWEGMVTSVRRTDKTMGDGFQCGTVTITYGILINGIIREDNGSAVDKPQYSWEDKVKTLSGYDAENTEKSAATDAFKRAAMKWGIGLYLQDVDGSSTDKNTAEKEFANWHRKTFMDSAPVERKHEYVTKSMPANTPAETGNNDNDEWSTWSPDIKQKLVLGLSEVFPGSHHMKLSGYNSLDKKEFEQIGTPRQVARKLIEWNYADANPVVVHYVRYVINSTSGRKYLQFAARLDTENTGHRIINAFGRSTEVKKLLDSVNFYLYAKNGLDAYGFAKKTTEWEELSIPMTVIYEGDEHLKLAGIIYNGEPSFIADKAVDF